MENFNQYNEVNISKLLDYIEELTLERRLKILPMLKDINAKIAEYNKNRPLGTNPVKAYSKSTFYKKIKDRKNLLNAIGKEAFNVTLSYLAERGLLEEEVCEHNLYFAVNDFLSISEESKKTVGELTPGYFRTYRPSITKPNYAIVGLLLIYKNEQGHLKTKELLPYRVNSTEKRRHHNFEGHIWYTCGYYLCLTTDSNTHFMQTLILRSKYVGEEQINTMEGSYSGITTQRGNRIYASSIYLERIHDEPESFGWFKMLRTLGSKKRDGVKQRDKMPHAIWETINPEGDENIHFF